MELLKSIDSMVLPVFTPDGLELQFVLDDAEMEEAGLHQQFRYSN
jgi:hypothetical protein